MELRQAGHTQLLANFARFFKAKKDQGSYEVRAGADLMHPNASLTAAPRRSKLRFRIFASSGWTRRRSRRQRYLAEEVRARAG
jgi:hypothetical protein